ncbi:MAG: YaaA family protein, partial [Flavobacteriales bacterium]
MATPSKLPGLPFSQPEFRKPTETILQKVGKWREIEIIEKMEVSATLARETVAMNKDIRFPMQLPQATPALLTFSGDVYRGLDASSLSEKQLIAADNCLRILSGMYGYLKPLQLIQPYRLMMGTPMTELAGYTSLASFWKPFITHAINEELNEKDTLVNLASQEYAVAFDENAICATV